MYVRFYAFIARIAWKERIMGWSRLSVCRSACFKLGNIVRIRMVRVLCHWELPPTRTVEYPMITGNKMADEKNCEVGPTVGK